MKVRLSLDALRDIDAIHTHILESDGGAPADRVLADLLNAARRLSRFPDRGSFPRELLAIGNRRYRQLVMGPYRLIYRVTEEQVFIELIADGRRDMQTLLTERLMRGPATTIAEATAAAELAKGGGSEPRLRKPRRRRSRDEDRG